MKTLTFTIIISCILHILLFTYFSNSKKNDNINFSAQESIVMVSIMQSQKGVITEDNTINKDDNNQQAHDNKKDIVTNKQGYSKKKKENKKQVLKNAKQGSYAHNESTTFKNGYASYIPSPKYPLSSRRNKEEGTVIFNIQINKEGKMVKYKIVSSSGYKKLDNAAENSIKYAKFQPAYKNGIALESNIDLKITFQLQGENK